MADTHNFNKMFLLIVL